jgi:hypothetical protein
LIFVIFSYLNHAKILSNQFPFCDVKSYTQTCAGGGQCHEDMPR